MNRTAAQRYNDRLDKIFEPNTKALRLENAVATKILEVAKLQGEVSTSDLQGVAQAKAAGIINLVTKKGV